jgi:hypothetical protein
MLKKLLVPMLVLTVSAIAGIGCRDSSGDATPYVPPPADASGDAPADGGTPDTAQEPDAQTDATADTGDASHSDATNTDATSTDATDAVGG